MVQSFKKTSMVISRMARDMLTLDVGEQVPTVASYAEMFDVSRGIIQEAFSVLQEEKSISLLKRGVKGTVLMEKDMSRLFGLTEWNIIRGTMPTPINPYLRSLATAIVRQMENKKIPFSFSYVMGGDRRSSQLDKQAYDFCVVSEHTALHACAEYNSLEIALQMAPCIYSMEYALFINKPNAAGIEDGMVVCLDSACYDQTQLSRRCASGRNVTFVENSAVTSTDLFRQKKFDALVTREGPWHEGMKDISILPIPETIADKYPVLITNRNNYGIRRLLVKCLNVGDLFAIQRQVLEDPSLEAFE